MKAIMACDYYGGIGKDGALPWDSLDGDMDRFVSLTFNSTIVMGHRTWNSLPKTPLPNRRNIVISRNSDLKLNGAEVINNIEQLKDLQDTWFIGGAELLSELWPLITEFHLTRATDLYDCDTYIDLLYLQQNFRRTHEYVLDDNTYEIWLRL